MQAESPRARFGAFTAAAVLFFESSGIIVLLLGLGWLIYILIDTEELMDKLSSVDVDKVKSNIGSNLESSRRKWNKQDGAPDEPKKE